MDKNLYTLAVDKTWFSDAFNHRQLNFSAENSGNHVWELGVKLSERYLKRLGKSEAIAVFQASQLHGPKVGQVAILKIHMQVPLKDGPHFSEDPRIRSELAGDEPFHEGLEEIQALQDMTHSGCPVSPKLLGSRIDKQDETMWVPGGYIIYTLMEKLPGRSVLDFWQWPRAKRDELREAFIDTLSQLIQHGYEPSDQGLRNLRWDDVNKKCYIVDFEWWYVRQDGRLDSNGQVTDPIGTFAFWELIRGSKPNIQW